MCKRHIFLVYLALLPAVCGSSAALAGTVYNFQLVGDGAVIAREGADTGFPSVIRVPSWVPSNERAAANANYYMYYGNHSGNRIRMKWAETLDGTWTEFNLGGTYNGKSRQGVFDPYADETRDSYDHIFSGDVHVDDVNERIIMYFHAKNQGPTYTMEDPPYTKIWKRHLQGFVATSHYGLNFNDPDYAGGEPGYGPVTHSTDGPTREVLLAETYMRVFESGGQFSAISKGGIMSQAPDPLNPWAPHPTLPYKEPAWNEAGTEPFGDFMTSSAFANHPKNPVPGDMIVDDEDAQRLNHVGVNLLPGGTQLEVFSYAANDADYKDIYRVIYDISDPDFNNWALATDGGEVIFDVVVTASEIRAAVEAAHPGGVDTANYADPVHISDPTIFIDDDGSKYMFYSYRSATRGGSSMGEGQISAIELIPVDGAPQPLKESRFTHATLEEEGWDPQTQGSSGSPMDIDTVKQQMDYRKDYADGGWQGQWNFDDVSSYCDDGDVWTISFDFMMDSRQSSEYGEIIVALGQNTCLELPRRDSPDRMVKIQLDEDGPGYWRFYTPAGGDDDDNLCNGLPFDVWFHCDIVFNKSGSTLTDYYGDEDLSDNMADLWLNGKLATGEYDLLKRGMAEGAAMESLVLRVDADQEGRANFDNFAVYDRVVVDTTVVEDITEGTPVAGMLGLGLIPAACAFGGTLAIRRKK